MSANSLDLGGNTPSLAGSRESIASPNSGFSTGAGQSPAVLSGTSCYSEESPPSRQASALAQDHKTRLVRYRVTDDLIPDHGDCVKITASQSMICFAGNHPVYPNWL